MFAESLLESGNVHHTGRSLATTLSLTFQAVLLAALVALPIFRPDRLPLETRPVTSPVAFGRPDLPQENRPAGITTHRPNTSQFQTPASIPARSSFDTVEIAGTETPPSPCVGNCGLPLGDPRGVPGGLRSIFTAPPPVVHPKPAERLVISSIDPGQLTHQVQPQYPVIAKSTGTEGQVVLRAIIDRDGRITSLTVVSGHPMLIAAARSAVQQWRYRPYLLNGQPVEVDTQITVNFRLAR